MRKEKSSTLYSTLPGDAGVAGIVPPRIVSKATTNRRSTDGGETGELCAPRIIFKSSRAARRLIEALYASRSVSGAFSQMRPG